MKGEHSLLNEKGGLQIKIETTHLEKLLIRKTLAERFRKLDSGESWARDKETKFVTTI